MKGTKAQPGRKGNKGAPGKIVSFISMCNPKMTTKDCSDPDSVITNIIKLSLNNILYTVLSHILSKF